MMECVRTLAKSGVGGICECIYATDCGYTKIDDDKSYQEWLESEEYNDWLLTREAEDDFTNF